MYIYIIIYIYTYIYIYIYILGISCVKKCVFHQLSSFEAACFYSLAH